MGANLSQMFATVEEADRWAAQQAKIAAQWNLQKTLDLGNRAVVRVPVISPGGLADELTIPLEPGRSLDQRLRGYLARTRLDGYREDHSRRRQPAFERSLRFD